jgi:hypothetical protein
MRHDMTVSQNNKRVLVFDPVGLANTVSIGGRESPQELGNHRYRTRFPPPGAWRYGQPSPMRH